MNRQRHRKWTKKNERVRCNVRRMPVACIRDMSGGKVRLALLRDASRNTIRQFFPERSAPGTTVRSDKARAYMNPGRLNRKHRTVNHSAGKYVQMYHTWHRRQHPHHQRR